jgi:ABC-type phosphate transport system substrate-binding protein
MVRVTISLIADVRGISAAVERASAARGGEPSSKQVMTGSTLESLCARMIALVLSSGLLGSLATAPASFAAGAGPKPPLPGSDCQTDGKISGRGSTFQTNAVNKSFVVTFQQVGPCGTTQPNSAVSTGYTGTPPNGAGGANTDPVGRTPLAGNPVASMIAYDAYQGVSPGSGAGLEGLSCRTDAFVGTDKPYSQADLTAIDGAPGTMAGGTPPSGCVWDNPSNSSHNNNAEFAPFGPMLGNGQASVAGDATANAMSIPIAGGAVAIAVNLNGMCTTPPAGINVTSQEFYDIWEGTINQWNDPHLVATNPILTADGCAGNIQRVVRPDNSGTTAIVMTDLNGIQSANGLSLTPAPNCTVNGSPPPTTWAQLAAANPNTGWPEFCQDAAGNVALPTVTGTTSGSPALISMVESTNGSIGYAELGLWRRLPGGVSFVHLQSQTATVADGFTNDCISGCTAADFVTAGTLGQASNCNIGLNGLPGGSGATANQAVGLDAGSPPANWASDATPNVENLTYAGAGYPLCALTFDMLYVGINPFPATAGATGATLTTTGPVQGLTFDQLRTEWDFFALMLSPLGQNGVQIQGAAASSGLNSQTYDTLPSTWLDLLRQGFQSNF